ncbi:glycoside hydrolase family 13 protein [Melanogaster broomeanus]|nr:glycoside hydrolase family 13 protein [Melanogaster broomeanus]
MVNQFISDASQISDPALHHLSVIPPEDLTYTGLAPTIPRTPADEGKEYFLSPRSDGEQPIHVYDLRLDPDGGPNKERSYIRLPPAHTPYILRVSLDAGTPASKNGVFKTNFPLDGGAFERDKFAERKLPTDFSKPIQVDLPISHAGAFVYWVEYDGDASGERVKGREGYFNVDPKLRIHARSSVLSTDLKPLLPSEGGAQLLPEYIDLPLDGIAMLTLVSKWMDPISQWRKHFQEASDRGYTMLHWTPLQERGASDSPYSIKDQRKYDLRVFDTSIEPEAAAAQMEDILHEAKEAYGLLSLTDVVLNHTASDSYSTSNTPHLTPALEIDTAIFEFSASLEGSDLPTLITSQQDIDTLMAALEEHLKSKNLWQFYVLDVQAEQAAVLSALSANAVIPWIGEDVAGKSVVALAEIARSSCLAAGLMKAAFVHIADDAEALAEAWKRVVDVLNVKLYAEWKDDTQTFASCEPYFTRLTGSESDPATYSLANNGWIWDADPLVNFALPPSKAYLRREVIVWGDCVKLRYGSSPTDNPWLWAFMMSYVVSLAKTFDGFRIDNCHSTPLHVGTAMLDAARKANPDLYVCAELFTGSEEMDLLFVRKLGVNSLVREAGNAWDPKEFSRVMYRFGLGKPIGSMDEACLTSVEELAPPFGTGPPRPCIVSPLNGSIPHAMMYDLTHDNESYLDKRTAEHTLSVAGIVTFGYCAVASVKGFDDLYPKLLNLVEEKRVYEVTGLEENSGLGRAKRVLNGLRREMVLGGYQEGHVFQDEDYIMIHRVHPKTQKGYLLVAHTAFSKRSKERGLVNPIELNRTCAKFVCGFAIDFSSYEAPRSSKTIKGLPGKLIDLPGVVVVQESRSGEPFCSIVVPDFFPPGSIMIFEVQDSVSATAALSSLDLVDLNLILYRADGEEQDATNGEISVYDVPAMGKLTYCGFEGWMDPLRGIMRKGTWAFDYTVVRLVNQTDEFPNLTSEFDRIKKDVPRFLRPKFFAIVISTVYKAARRAAIEQLSEFVSTGHDFTQNLALSTPSLAAGLPHFSTGWARCWGRDVFISLRGLFLTTGIYEGAKRHILAFASTLKHGLIPNLLDSVRNPRYNSRDSPMDYVDMAPDGISILSEPVRRRFPADDSWVAWNDPRAYAYTSTLAEVIQEILQRHASGISFREHNAGPNLDMQMKAKGFDIDIHVDWETGFVFGGSEFNCGTWMDKMGESVKAGTKRCSWNSKGWGSGGDRGVVEEYGEVVGWVGEEGKDAFVWCVCPTVDGKDRLVTYGEWSDLIQRSFEMYFYVPQDSLDPVDDFKHVVDEKLVNRRGIYKDVYGSGRGREWSDYQLRPNFPIAMAVAPELFEEEHALYALRLADKVLRGPLGMKTWTQDKAVAKGLNYHNGPEWGWPLGYFLRAYLHFDMRVGSGREDPMQTLHYLHRALLKPRYHIQSDPWAGLPELTNKDGAYCRDSCNTQAWSASTLLDFLGETSSLEQDKKNFLAGGLQESEDLAVYTWGEDSYDGLGDALQEGGDELNDETFGTTGAVGQSITSSVPEI